MLAAISGSAFAPISTSWLSLISTISGRPETGLMAQPACSASGASKRATARRARERSATVCAFTSTPSASRRAQPREHALEAREELPAVERRIAPARGDAVGRVAADVVPRVALGPDREAQALEPT